jgi:heme oxygenase
MLLHLINIITAYRPNKFSKEIKVQTKKKHDEIEAHPLLQELIKGTLPDYKYGIYLVNLLPIYTAVEKSVFNCLTSSDLIQTDKIRNDLLAYTKDLNLNFNNDQAHFYKPWLEYFFTKKQLYKKTELYVRWLADMYGGQILKKKVKHGEKYQFNNLRKCIKTVRKKIEEDIDESNIDKFILEVNVTYDFHYKLADKVYECTEDLVQ